MDPIEFVEVDPSEIDERPTLGPPCPGYSVHRWTLIIEDGSVLLGSGCDECDLHLATEEVTTELTGRLSFEHEHDGGRCPNAIRFLPCDCNYWWRFTPEESV